MANAVSSTVLAWKPRPAPKTNRPARETDDGTCWAGVTVWQEAGFVTKLVELVGAGQLAEVETSIPYQPMPYSKTESGYLTGIHVYRRS